MFSYQPGGISGIFQHPREFQLWSAKAEIHRRLPGTDHKIRQIIVRPQPGENAVTVSTPGNNLLASHIFGQLPTMFLRISLDAAMQPVIIPA